MSPKERDNYEIPGQINPSDDQLKGIPSRYLSDELLARKMRLTGEKPVREIRIATPFYSMSKRIV